MPQYRRKPNIVEAFQITKETRQSNVDWPNWLHEAWNKSRYEDGAVYPFSATGEFGEGLCIRAEGVNVYCAIGDYIVRKENGDIYSCKPDVFEDYYEKI
jgi:sulfatase maturation enzyme AslB (radical SAM superfamily)